MNTGTVTVGDSINTETDSFSNYSYSLYYALVDSDYNFDSTTSWSSVSINMKTSDETTTRNYSYSYTFYAHEIAVEDLSDYDGTSTSYYVFKLVKTDKKHSDVEPAVSYATADFTLKTK